MEEQQNYKNMLEEDRASSQKQAVNSVVKDTAKKAIYKFFISLALWILPYAVIVFLVIVVVVVLMNLFNFTGSVPDADMKELKSLGIKDNSPLMTLTTGVQFNQD